MLELREQKAAAWASFQRMEAEAERLGADLVERGRVLDRTFAAGVVTPDELASRTAAIGALQGRLRAVYLAAHLEMRAVLTPEQVARYDARRGYGGNDGGPAVPEGHGTH